MPDETHDGVPISENIYRNYLPDGTNQNFSTFRMLCRWKGSCFKLIWKDLTVFMALYFALSILYRYILSDTGKLRFELICIRFDDMGKVIPISFLVGFYVSSIVKRWWDQYTLLPRPDKVAMLLVNLIAGKDDFTKNLRRAVMRYINLSTVLVYRLLAEKVEKRFPNFDSMVDAKLLLPNEATKLRRIQEKRPNETKWAPLNWALKLVAQARQGGKIKLEPPVYATVQKAILEVEVTNQKLLNFGWVNFPMAYVHVATISVYMYFVAALFGRQFLDPPQSDQLYEQFSNISIAFASKGPYNAHTPDSVFPFFGLMEFFCYVGWIKVAENLLNPFGEDDEDFKLNYLIDRNLQVSYLIVEEAESEMELEKDPFLEAGIEVPGNLTLAKNDIENVDASKALV